MKELNLRPAPFWFLNDRFEREEIKKQLLAMKESGVSGVFLHPRAGNTTQPYGSELWFEGIDVIVEECKKLSLDVWLYDEDPFPSGIAGGRVVYENPEFIARSINVEKLVADENGIVSKTLGEVKVLSAYAVKTDQNGNIVSQRDVTCDVGMVREEWYKFMHKSSYYCDVIGKIIYKHWRAEAFFPKMKIYSKVEKDETVYVAYTKIYRNGDKFCIRPDNLNPECVRSFIKLTHERYRERYGENFGKSIKGIFTDEPAAGAITPFTKNLPKLFFKEYGYDINQNYMHLFYDFGNRSQTVRSDYLKLVEEMFSKTFFKQIGKWCKKNNLLFTGHILAEEDPVDHALTGGNVYRCLQHMDIPGFDLVGNLLGDRNHIALAFGAKLATSVSHQRGIDRTAGELLSCNPFNFDLKAARRIVDWALCMDVNFVVPHGFFYAYGGDRKFDAGKSFFFQDPYFSEFPQFASYIERTASTLSQYESSAKILLLYPSYGFYAQMPANRGLAIALRNKLFQATKSLFEKHIEFDVADCKALETCSVRNGKIKIGKKKYDAVVCVQDDSVPMQEFYKLLSEKGANVVMTDENGNFSNLDKYQLTLKRVFGECRDLFVLQKKKGRERLYFYFQNSHESVSFIPKLKKRENAYVLDCETGEYYNLQPDTAITLSGYEKALVIISDAEKQTVGNYQTDLTVKAGDKVTYEYETNPEWEYIPPIDVKEVITNYNAKVGKKQFKNVKYERLRYHIGTDERRKKKENAGFDVAEWPKAIYPIDATFTTTFAQYGLKKPALLFEGETFIGEYQIFINGKPTGAPSPKRVYDLTNLVLDISDLVIEGTNSLDVVFTQAGEFDGINSAVYLVDLNDLGE